MTKAPATQPWRIVAAEIIAATKADPDSLRRIYEDREFRPSRKASIWAQLAARLAQERKAYREAVAGRHLKEVQHTMLRRCFAHDYSQPGSYMITLVVPERGSNPFGTVKGDVRSGRKGVTLTPDAVAQLLHTGSLHTGSLHTGSLHTGSLQTDPLHTDPLRTNPLHTNPLHTDPLRLEQTLLGATVLEALDGITANYPMVEVRKAQLMPDHLHMILVVHAPIISSKGKPRHLGHVIAGYKTGCNKARRLLLAQHNCATPSTQGATPSTQGATPDTQGATTGVVELCSTICDGSATTPDPTFAPLWAEGYTDTIILSNKHMDTEEAYLDDNIYRLRMKQLHRNLLRTVLHIRINGQDFAALGNIHLLRRPRKEQVQFHHWEADVPAGFVPCDRSWECQRFYNPAAQLQDTAAPGTKDTATPGTKDTAAPGTKDTFTLGEPITGPTEAEAHTERLLQAGDSGAVFASPFISETEKAIRDAALTMGIPYIRLTREGFRDLYTPTKSEFEACCEGDLLILAPWKDRRRTSTITRRECMELNKVAAMIAGDDLELVWIKNENDCNETIIPRDDE